MVILLGAAFVSMQSLRPIDINVIASTGTPVHPCADIHGPSKGECISMSCVNEA